MTRLCLSCRTLFCIAFCDSRRFLPGASASRRQPIVFSLLQLLNSVWNRPAYPVAVQPFLKCPGFRFKSHVFPEFHMRYYLRPIGLGPIVNPGLWNPKDVCKIVNTPKLHNPPSFLFGLFAPAFNLGGTEIQARKTCIPHFSILPCFSFQISYVCLSQVFHAPREVVHYFCSNPSFILLAIGR